MKIILFLNFLHQLIAEPVCIIGGGITGLTIAHRLKDDGQQAIIFEKDNYVGGKALTWRQGNKFTEMGPVVFSENSTNSLALFKKHNAEIYAREHTEFKGFIVQTNVSVTVPATDISEAQKRYFEIRKGLKLSPGYLEVDPELYLPLAKWLIKNNLKELIPAAEIMITISGYGSIYDIPTMYALNIIDEHGDLSKSVYSVKNGLDKVFKAHSKDLDVRLSHEVIKLQVESENNQPKVFFKSPKGFDSVSCSKIVTAFPPYYYRMQPILNEHPILEPLKDVRMIKYVSFVTQNEKLEFDTILALLGKNASKIVPIEPKGDGRVIGLLRGTGAYTGYSWVRGPSPLPASNLELVNMYELIKQDITTLTGAPTTIPYYRNLEYFPHYFMPRETYFTQIHEAQGKNKLFLASPLLSFESIHHSIEGANYVYDTYLKPNSY